MWAGIDYSMTCPSITVGTSNDFSKCKTFYYIDHKKLVGKFKYNIYGTKSFPYEHEIERYDNIAQWALTVLKQYKVTEVCLEGYAMRAVGKVFNISENTALLKYHMWKNNIQYYTPAPTAVKKEFSGKGNSNKIGMHDAFVDKTGIDVGAFMGKTPDKSPVSDIVDSYAMLCYGITYYFK